MQQIYLISVCLGVLLLNSIPLHAQCTGDHQQKFENSPDIILDEKISDKNGVPGLRVCFLIQCNRQEIWGMLTDYDHFQKIYGGIDSLRVLSRDKSGARVEFYQSTFFKNLNYVLDRRYVREGYELSWRKDSGDLEIIYGSWLIEESPLPDYLLVTYTNFFRYGGIVPDKIPRNWAIKQVHITAENARQWLDENRELY